MPQKRKSLDEGALEFFISKAPQSVNLLTKADNSVPLESIRLPKQQPRRYFDLQKMQQLITSVKEHGILEPLLVRPISEGQYELVAGERRYRAAQEIKLANVPVVVRSLSDEEALQLALIENLQREDLNPVEETEGILQLLAIKLEQPVEKVISHLYRMYNEAKGNINTSNPNVRVNAEKEDLVVSNPNVRVSAESQAVQAVFDSLALMAWESFVKNRLPLLNLPDEILETLRRGEIAYTKATLIARIKNEVERQSLLQDTIKENLSLTQIKERINKLKESEAKTQSIQEAPLKNRIDKAYQVIKKTKTWDDPKKQKRLEKLITAIEALINESN
ncbi:ParB/RepB/Spo0J family partition protein [Komarekiella sp. 'clone 1']|uniref:ParB/RepB/Spo0J family partition protein n=1 Tax=Komarekiella delphini-convector SJRDD-AB1 TaxID=2593771 RepID=A0AA40VV94_9NOST|nr:ParB/RepB/Spo0J family partition protein [Komarekiella delphini-convector]MBD6620746.1 ParB/RepB/Spo0J family partition protein [Komarekiella delphini-convector SJRDD-AB1]